MSKSTTTKRTPKMPAASKQILNTKIILDVVNDNGKVTWAVQKQTINMRSFSALKDATKAMTLLSDVNSSVTITKQKNTDSYDVIKKESVAIQRDTELGAAEAFLAYKQAMKESLYFPVTPKKKIATP